MPEADILFQRLCDHFDREAERQETVREVCRAQAEAARLRNVQELAAKTEALRLLINENIAAERERLGLLRLAVVQLELPPERHTMSALIEAIPEPWAERLRGLQQRLRTATSESRAILRQSRPVIRTSLRIVNRAWDAVFQQNGFRCTAYTEQGETLPAGAMRPAVFNRTG